MKSLTGKLIATTNIISGVVGDLGMPNHAMLVLYVLLSLSSLLKAEYLSAQQTITVEAESVAKVDDLIAYYSDPKVIEEILRGQDATIKEYSDPELIKRLSDPDYADKQAWSEYHDTLLYKIDLLGTDKQFALGFYLGDATYIAFSSLILINEFYITHKLRNELLRVAQNRLRSLTPQQAIFNAKRLDHELKDRIQFTQSVLTPDLVKTFVCHIISHVSILFAQKKMRLKEWASNKNSNLSNASLIKSLFADTGLNNFHNIMTPETWVDKINHVLDVFHVTPAWTKEELFITSRAISSTLGALCLIVAHGCYNRYLSLEELLGTRAMNFFAAVNESQDFHEHEHALFMHYFARELEDIYLLNVARWISLKIMYTCTIHTGITLAASLPHLARAGGFAYKLMKGMDA